MSDIKVFQCPNCKQFINNTMTVCKYCSIQLDANLISGLIVGQEKADAAYNAASKLRILSGAMWVFFFVGFVPFLGYVATWAFYVIAVLIPILLLVWYAKYGNLKTIDAEFKTAKKYLHTAFFIWLIYPALLLMVTAIVIIGAMALNSK